MTEGLVVVTVTFTVIAERKEHGDKHDTSDGERFRQSLRLEYQGAKDALS